MLMDINNSEIVSNILATFCDLWDQFANAIAKMFSNLFFFFVRNCIIVFCFNIKIVLQTCTLLTILCNNLYYSGWSLLVHIYTDIEYWSVIMPHMETNPKMGVFLEASCQFGRFWIRIWTSDTLWWTTWEQTKLTDKMTMNHHQW